ncbi:MAG TPA: glycosyltransferase [Burkholderiaceae bacterium]
MRILMISDVYFPRVNGVSTSILTFQQELAAQGHEVHIVAPHYPAGHPEEAHISRIESGYVMLDPEDRLMKSAKIHELTPKFHKHEFDIVHIQTPFLAHYAGIKLARALDVPTIETYHTFFEEYLYHYVPLLPKFITRRITRSFSRSQCNSVNAVIVPSTAMSSVLTQYGCTTPIHIAPTGIQMSKFESGMGSRFRAKHNIPEDRHLLLHVGRVAHEKNIGFLLGMVAQLKVDHPQVLFLICGEGPAKTDLEQQVKRMGLADNVMFVGYLDRETELLDCYRAADVFVFASRTETQGLVLLEAMALGVPVVSTAVMGTIDILSPKRGALVAEENTEDFSAKVSRLLNNRELRLSIGDEGRAYAQTWSAPATARRVVDIYQGVIEARNTGLAPAVSPL